MEREYDSASLCQGEPWQQAANYALRGPTPTRQVCIVHQRSSEMECIVQCTGHSLTSTTFDPKTKTQFFRDYFRISPFPLQNRHMHEPSKHITRNHKKQIMIYPHNTDFISVFATMYNFTFHNTGRGLAKSCAYSPRLN